MSLVFLDLLILSMPVFEAKPRCCCLHLPHMHWCLCNTPKSQIRALLIVPLQIMEVGPGLPWCQMSHSSNLAGSWKYPYSSNYPKKRLLFQIYPHNFSILDKFQFCLDGLQRRVEKLKVLAQLYLKQNQSYRIDNRLAWN